MRSRCLFAAGALWSASVGCEGSVRQGATPTQPAPEAQPLADRGETRPEPASEESPALIACLAPVSPRLKKWAAKCHPDDLGSDDCAGGAFLSAGMRRWAGNDGTYRACALVLAERSCEAGHLGGCATLGNVYLYAEGAEQDLARAEEVFDRICEEKKKRGEPEPCVELAIARVAQGEGVDEAIEVLETACSASANVSACFVIGNVYHQGKHVPKDLARAREHWERGCSRNFLPACRRIEETRQAVDQGPAEPESTVPE